MSNKIKEKQSRDLDSKRIAEAAIAVIDDVGYEGFTMRSVANALGVTPMALYHHVKDKAGLAGLIVDVIMREVALPPTSGDWRNDLWETSNWIRQISLSHPNARYMRGEFQIATAGVLHIADRWLSLWQQSGLPYEKAVTAARSSRTAVTGYVMEEITLQEMIPPDEAALGMLPNARVMFEKSENKDEEFELAARAIIDGIYQQLSEE